MALGRLSLPFRLGAFSARRPARQAVPRGIHGVWWVRPKLWRSQVGHTKVAEACPKTSKPFVEPPLRGYGIMGRVALGDEVLKVLRMDGARSIEDAAIRSMLDEASREVCHHDGGCACGKKTYLFSRCPTFSTLIRCSCQFWLSL